MLVAKFKFFVVAQQ